MRADEGALQSSTPPADKVTVSAVRLTSYEPQAVDDALLRLLGPLGGIEAFVAGKRAVVLKPNFLAPRPAHTATCTHPEIIRGVARLVRTVTERRCAVIDSPGVGSARRVAAKLGLDLEADSYVVEDAEQAVELEKEGSRFHHLRLCRSMVEADCLINLPKAKTHGQMTMTAAVKNTYGAVMGLDKAQWHYRAGRKPRAFAELIVHVHLAVRPKLHILDAVVGMDGNGPGAGRARQLGFLLASRDAFALDSVLARSWGLEPRDVPYLEVADAKGLVPSPSRICLVGQSFESLRPSSRWMPARPRSLQGVVGPSALASLIDKLISLRPRIDSKACIGCGHCETVCAARAITLERLGERPVARVDKKSCISCFCCQEICPVGAITVAAGPAARLLGLAGATRPGRGTRRRSSQ